MKKVEPPKEPARVAWHQRGLLATLSRRERSDVLGSYTGTPAEDDVPVQDADDL